MDLRAHSAKQINEVTEEFPQSLDESDQRFVGRSAKTYTSITSSLYAQS